MTLTLTKPEKSVLAECEAEIERGLNNFVEVGNALLRIRNERLYRAEFGTFQEYCEARWQMSRGHAHRMIEAAGVAENLSPIGDKPVSESITRSLAPLTPKQQREVWQEASDTAKEPGKPTAKEVKLVVEKVTNPTSRTSPSATPEQDSELLSLLKSYWTAANRTERAKFLAWVKQ